MELQREYWWEEWIWKEHILPAWFDTKNKMKVDEQNLGYQFFYNDKPLWMYTGELETLLDIDRLLDVLLRGDAISRLKAMIALEQIDDENPQFLDIIHVWDKAESEDDLVDQGASLAYLPWITKPVKELTINVNETQFDALREYARAVWWRLDPSIDDETRYERDKLASIHTAKRKSKKKQIQAMAAIKKPKREPTELDLLFPWIPMEGEEEAAIKEAYSSQESIQQQFEWSPKPPTKPISSPSSPTSKPKPYVPISMPAKPISSPASNTNRLRPMIPAAKQPIGQPEIQVAAPKPGERRLPPIPGRRPKA